MQNSHLDAHRLRRVFAIARRPSTLIAIAHSTQGHLDTIPLDELRLMRKAADLAMKREGARSAMRHWSYDMNRHIAIRSARDRILAEIRKRKTPSVREINRPRTDPRPAIDEMRPI